MVQQQSGKRTNVRLIMTLLVRNAEGLLRQNLEFHLHQGVDFFIVTDNGSNDRTAEIIDEYVRRGLARRIWEPGTDYSQARWVTRMARAAAIEHGADWVINNDDDEFWSAGARTLRDEVALADRDCEGLVVERYNHPPVAGQDGKDFLEEMVYRENRSTNLLGDPLPPKVCHRGYADIEVGQGNHFASLLGRPLVCRPATKMAISHFPVRDFASFERKIVQGGQAYARNQELHPDVGYAWRWLYKLWCDQGLGDWYERQLLRPEHIEERLARGTLVVDDAVLRTLRARGAV
jgi:hypothetical protein